MAEAEAGATDAAETKGAEETVSMHALTPAVISSVTINSHVTRTIAHDVDRQGHSLSAAVVSEVTRPNLDQLW